MKHYLLISLLLLLLGANLAAAQENPLPPGDYYAIGTYDESNENGQLMAFAPGSTEGIVLATTPDAGPDLSPDGRWFAEVDSTNGQSIVYGEIGAEPLTLAIPETVQQVTGITFKTDSTGLAYTTADEEGNWTVNLFDLASSETTSFGGQIGELPQPLPPFEFYGAPRVLNWNGDTLIVQLFDPINFADGYNGLFAIDISGLTAGETDQPAPEAVSLFAPLYEQFPYYFGELWNQPNAQESVPGLTNSWTLSPDGTMIALPYYDPEAPVQNRVPCAQGCDESYPNRIVVFDLFNGEIVIDIGATEGDGLWFPIWTQDSRTVAFPTGSFYERNFFGAPRLALIDLETQMVEEVLTISEDNASFAQPMAICGNTLFFLYYPNSDDMWTGTLSSVPMDGSETPTALFTNNFINTAGCISVEG